MRNDPDCQQSSRSSAGKRDSATDRRSRAGARRAARGNAQPAAANRRKAAADNSTSVHSARGTRTSAAAGNARRAAAADTMRPPVNERHHVDYEEPAAPARPLVPALIAMAVVFVLAVGGLISSCAPSSTDGAGANAEADAQNAAVSPATVHFVAVGDNLPEEQIGAYADAQAGTTGDGEYDYTSIYENIKPIIESADLAYVKEETHCGGDDIGPKGYPSFNTTDSMADALVDTGFDLVGSASNHSYDWGYFGANDHSCELWKTRDVVFTGTADCAEDAAKIATIERNGITFALLDYTYGVNGYEESDLPSYAVNFIDKDRIASDVKKAREQGDVVLVAMHWGTENLMEADETQLEYAQYLADLGVDVVLGSHPHVIGPLAWVEGSSGKKTLVAYSLGNFLSRHESPTPKNELEGMLSCDFVRGDGGTVAVQNVVWTPLVNHTDGETFRIYTLKDYTNELAAQDSAFDGLEDPVAWLKETNAEVVGSDFTIDV